jgi:hypothetical protein
MPKAGLENQLADAGVMTAADNSSRGNMILEFIAHSPLLNGSLPAQTHRHKKTETEGPQAPHFQQRFQTASRSIPGAY